MTATIGRATGTGLLYEEYDEDESPRVSVGLPVYNGEDYLELALRSLLKQDYDDFELIVSDNASTDATQAICLDYAGRDPRVRYIREDPNKGAAWNFNHVLQQARGEFFRWACHDDLVSPGHLGRCVTALDGSAPSVILAYTRSNLIDAEGRDMGLYEDGLHTVGLPPHRRFGRVARRLRYVNMLYGVWRREALLQTRGLGGYESADNVLIAELSLLGEFLELPEVLFHRRVHPRMSRKANLGPKAVAAWFDPSNKSRFHFPHARLFREYTAAALRAPLSPRERVLTLLALRLWARREARPVVLGALQPVLRRTQAAK